MAESCDYKIEHQGSEPNTASENQGRFVLFAEDKKGQLQECLLEYTLSGDQVDFHRTYVPFSLRSRGLAEVLVAEGLRWAKGENLQIHASCWYVAKFL